MRQYSIIYQSLQRAVIALVVVVSAGMSFGHSVNALSVAQKSVFSNGIYEFDTEVATCDTGNSTQLSAEGLPTDIAKSIETLKHQYEQAATATGVPWQLIAAVHYREGGNNPSLDLQAGNPIGGPWNNAASYPYGHPKDLEQSAEFAAKQLIGMSSSGGVVNKPINTPSPDPEAIKDTLYSYNGRAEAYAQQAAALGFDPVKQPYEGSPYVMNNFDSKHMNMKIITRNHGGLDGTDTRFGAYTIYTKLGGAMGGGGCPNGAVAGNAVQTAMNYAWPDYHPAPYLVMKPEYQAAINKAKAAGEYVGGLDHPGVDCGGFVTRVMRDSGADPNYNWGPNDPRQGPTTSQQAYLDAHPEKYERLGPMTDTSKLLPGDIAINSSHTYIYVGKQPGFNGNSASASVSFTESGWRTPMASNAYFSNSSGSFIWYRLKG